jgi:hypothetical protein
MFYVTHSCLYDEPFVKKFDKIRFEVCSVKQTSHFTDKDQTNVCLISFCKLHSLSIFYGSRLKEIEDESCAKMKVRWTAMAAYNTITLYYF